MAFESTGKEAVQALTATFPGILAAVGGDLDKLEAAIAQIEQDAITRAIPAIGDMEKQVIDYALAGIARLLDNQRINLGSEIDRRFVAMGAVITAFGQAISDSSKVR